MVCDKVMCMGLSEWATVDAAIRTSGKMYTVFHNRRWDGDFLTAKKLYEEGTLGTMRWIEMSWNRHGLSKAWRSSRGGGRADVGPGGASGGSIADIFSAAREIGLCACAS